ncbi:MAG: ISNCY family transposase [Bacteroidales bacterium]|nr:ISNCY family transposase [Bacteroidales bacterium]
MQLFEDFKIRFEQPNWQNDLELGLIDSILDKHPHIISILGEGLSNSNSKKQFGRKDTPSIEQVVRAGIYKELKGLDYRQLEYHQEDSRIAALFIKIDPLRPYSFQLYQKYISRIKPEKLSEVLVELNKIAINEGLEDLEKIRQDTTTIETNIHHPTNNALIWDCIRKSNDHLNKLCEEVSGLSYRDYTKGAKKTYFKINNTASKDKKTKLFIKQLQTFTKSINQVSNVIKKKDICDSIEAMVYIFLLEDILPIMKQVYDISFRKEIKGEKIPSSEKIFSIFERHTDIIVKGSRDVIFGHKINLTSGKSNLILDCYMERGNPADSKLYAPTLDRVIENYDKIPRDSAVDGGFASKANIEHSIERGLVNVVFNKIVGSMKNQVSSCNMETRLKKWRSGIEANISNLKRGFKIHRCNWKGWVNFQSKVLWSILAYNIRVMSNLLVGQMSTVI